MSRKEKKLLNKPIASFTDEEHYQFMQLLDKLNKRGLSQQKRDRIQK